LAYCPGGKKEGIEASRKGKELPATYRARVLLQNIYSLQPARPAAFFLFEAILACTRVAESEILKLLRLFSNCLFSN
jgi:hypothetical protein